MQQEVVNMRKCIASAADSRPHSGEASVNLFKICTVKAFQYKTGSALACTEAATSALKMTSFTIADGTTALSSASTNVLCCHQVLYSVQNYAAATILLKHLTCQCRSSQVLSKPATALSAISYGPKAAVYRCSSPYTSPTISSPGWTVLAQA